mmetsp:Transcript_6521/g.8175  ORF Transcript_6521/g.8175 Transcript_6521/m.8175 type:complete len:240 (-) Transcript_6521:95-814(-)
MKLSIAISLFCLSTSAAFTNVGSQRKASPLLTEGVKHNTVSLLSVPDDASEVVPELCDQADDMKVSDGPSVKSAREGVASFKGEVMKVGEAVKPKKVGKSPAHKDGVFTPVVVAAKGLIGDDNLKKVRGKVISLHSDVIKEFVKTSDSEFGQNTLKTLFRMADKNGDGTLDEEELEAAFKKLGFTWLQEKQVRGILKRADANGDGSICIDEFTAEAPKTLKTNLTKLAKKNGGEMGLLS